MKKLLVWLALGVGTAMASDQSPAAGATAEVVALDARDWGIRNGCIPYRTIKRVNFISNDIGIIELVGGRKIQVTLRSSCSGIGNEGYVHKPINGQFCEGDLLRVIHYGDVCVVDKIQPFVASAQP